jgi:hypothetical protein
MAQDVNDAKRTEAFANELKTLKSSTAGLKSSKGSVGSKSSPRTATSSFAKKSQSSTTSSTFNYQPTGDPELDRVLAMIKKYVDQTTGATGDDKPSAAVASQTKAASSAKSSSISSKIIGKGKGSSSASTTKSSSKSSSWFGQGNSKGGTSSVEDEVVDATAAQSTADSKRQLDEKIDKMSTDSAAKLAKASPEAIAYKYAGAIAQQTLMQDASNTINEVIESARQITDDMTVKQVEAEGQINETISQTEQSATDVLQNINDVASQASEALDYINQLKDQALYAHNAAGQAMAAQMAQAMGFPISAKGITSPFPPPPQIGEQDVEQAAIPIEYIVAQLFLREGTRKHVGSFI